MIASNGTFAEPTVTTAPEWRWSWLGLRQSVAAWKRGVAASEAASIDRTLRAIDAFCGGCERMERLGAGSMPKGTAGNSGGSGSGADLAPLVKELVSAMRDEASAHASSGEGTKKRFPALYVSTGIMLTLIVLLVQMAYSYGSLNTRVAAIEAKTQGIEVVTSKLDSLQQEFRRFTERYERRTDESAAVAAAGARR